MTLAATGAAPSPGLGPRCTVAGCTGALRARGYCGPHYVRWQRHGDPRAAVPVTRRTPEGLTYRSAHRRVRATRGPAAAQPCAECTAPAVVWSYDGTDPDERTDPRGHRYSLDTGRYRPRCRPCQPRATGGGRAPRDAMEAVDVERAARLYRGGATARGIGALLHRSPATVLAALRAHGVAIRPPARAPRR